MTEDELEFKFCFDYGPTPVSTDGLDFMRRGKIEDDKQYLGHGAWKHLNVELSKINEHREMGGFR